MIFERKSVQLKNGTHAIFRSPVREDAAELLRYLKQTASETHFVLRYPEECTLTQEQEEVFLQRVSDSRSEVMIICEIDSKIAGNCQLTLKTKLKNRHRGMVAIALLRDYWNLGIGTAMFEEMISIAKNHGITQLELEFIEGNDRAKALYEKMGFTVVAAIPNAIHLKDDTSLKEYYMVKPL